MSLLALPVEVRDWLSRVGLLRSKERASVVLGVVDPVRAGDGMGGSFPSLIVGGREGSSAEFFSLLVTASLMARRPLLLVRKNSGVLAVVGGGVPASLPVLSLKVRVIGLEAAGFGDVFGSSLVTTGLSGFARSDIGLFCKVGEVADREPPNMLCTAFIALKPPLGTTGLTGPSDSAPRPSCVLPRPL